jgi:hypothetical protein
MPDMVQKAAFSTTLIFNFLVGFGVVPSFPAEPDLSVIVKNETGYDLEEVKYVLEMGQIKTLMERARDVSNGGSCTFRLKEGGAYRVYASFIMDGKEVYAKGNANSLRDGGRYRLTLKKVIFSEGGAGMNFINKSEFDAIR